MQSLRSLTTLLYLFRHRYEKPENPEDEYEDDWYQNRPLRPMVMPEFSNLDIPERTVSLRGKTLQVFFVASFCLFVCLFVCCLLACLFVSSFVSSFLSLFVCLFVFIFVCCCCCCSNAISVGLQNERREILRHDTFLIRVLSIVALLWSAGDCEAGQHCVDAREAQLPGWRVACRGHGEREHCGQRHLLYL